MRIVRLVIKTFVAIFLLGVVACAFGPGLIGLWNGTVHKSTMKPIVLTNDVEFVVCGKQVKLPCGLVLYPLNELECCSDVNDGHEYKIYVNSSVLNFREVLDAEIYSRTNLIYRIERISSGPGNVY